VKACAGGRLVAGAGVPTGGAECCEPCGVAMTMLVTCQQVLLLLLQGQSSVLPAVWHSPSAIYAQQSAMQPAFIRSTSIE